MNSIWLQETPRAARTQRATMPSSLLTDWHMHSKGSNSDDLNGMFQSTPISHSNAKGRGSGTPLNVGSPMTGHSPAVDEGYHSSLSSQSTLMTGCIETDDAKMPMTTGMPHNAQQSRACYGMIRGQNNIGTVGPQSAFSPVLSNSNGNAADPQKRMQTANAPANSFWSTLAALRQQLHQKTSTIQPTVLHPMIVGHTTATTSANVVPIPPITYMPNSLFWPVEHHGRLPPVFWPPYSLDQVVSPVPAGTTTTTTTDNLCERMVAKVRQEMLDLVDTSMKQLECFLLQGIVARGQSVYSQSAVPVPTSCMSTVPSSTSPLRDDHFCTDHGLLNIEPPSTVTETPLLTGPQEINSQHCETSKHPLRVFPRGRHHHQPRQQTQHLYTHDTAARRRRLRIRSSGRRLRIRQSATAASSRQNNTHLEQPVRLDGTLDLRIRREWANISSVREEYPELRHDLSESYELPEQSEKDDDLAKTMTLTGTHLKRAKLMFLYARYPNSSVLKTFFPEVVFTRSTTAQMVKWFSNFREFFYIQIEKYARQCKADGMKAKDPVLITRDHQLFRTLELHYNKDREIETPNEFLRTTQVAAQEFFQAVCTGADQDTSWKKAIYKIIAPMDVSFPEFLKQFS